MLLRRLNLRNVRSTQALEVELGPGVTILVGPNGVGKTTLLEAANLVLAGVPLRAGASRDLITDGQDHLRVEAALEENGATVTAAAAYSRDGERRLTANGALLADCSRWREALPVRTFVPDDLRLIKGGPRRRREYLDSLASQRDPEYEAELAAYEQALTQRNALLRLRRGSLGSEEFAPWEKILAREGLAITGRRAATLASFVAAFQRLYSELTGEAAESLHLSYRTNVASLDEDTYAARLAEMRSADHQRTYTHLGPHRDDFRLIRNGLDMRDCASQGEQRAALLTLVLVEWEHQCTGGRRPLLLLDDVMSELDQERRRALVRLLRRGGQVVVTTTDLRYFAVEELDDATVVELGPAAR